MNLIEHINETFHQSMQLQMESLPVVIEPVANSAELIVRRLLEGGRSSPVATGEVPATPSTSPRLCSTGLIVRDLACPQWH